MILPQQAAFSQHDGRAEIGQVRLLMQAGEYRRALALAAHVAQGHPDVAGGAALYAQLLDLGGLGQLAGELRPQVAAARLGPASPESASLPATVRAVASGVVVGDGRTAFAPATALEGAKRLWVRNGLGAVSAATQLRAHDGLAVLLLERPLAGGPAIAPADPFPGSQSFAVAYADGSAPAWPALHAGFVGKRLRIESPAGPVFDAAGRLAGFAVPGGRLLPASVLKSAGVLPAADSEPAKLAADEIYERALAVTLQILAQD